MLRQKVFYPAGRVVSPMETQKKKDEQEARWRCRETLLNKPHKYKSTVINVIFGDQYVRRQQTGAKGGKRK